MLVGLNFMLRGFVVATDFGLEFESSFSLVQPLSYCLFLMQLFGFGVFDLHSPSKDFYYLIRLYTGL